MIVNTGRNMKRKSYVLPIALSELLLAFLLYFYPDWAKVFLFGLPLVLIFGEAFELLYKYFKKKGTLLQLSGGLLLLACGIFLIFLGRKTYMVGIGVLMLFETCRFFHFSTNKDIRLYEKLISLSAGVLSLIWFVLIMFKGLHLYWSVREYLALYFIGSGFFAIMHKK